MQTLTSVIIPESKANLTLPTALDELKNAPQWVCWQYVTRDGKRTKVPYRADRVGKAKANGPTTWTTYNAAVAACLVPHSTYEGVGFQFGNGYAGVDLDSAIDEHGQLKSWARAVVDKLDSYTELSPSGKGLHIVVKNSQLLDKALANNPTSIEAYTNAHFFTMTGKPLPGTRGSVEDRTEALHALVAEARADWKIINDLLRSDKALWDGDYSAYDNDHSRADLGLCSKLAYPCGKDAAQMDRVFRHSGLMRDKWDSPRDKWDNPREKSTYGRNTIGKALTSSTQPTTALTSSAQPATGTGQVTEGMYPLTDTGNAERLVAQYKDTLRYTKEVGWVSYTGTRWVVDEDAPYRAAIQVCRNTYKEAANAEGKAAREELAKWALDSESKYRQEAMVKQAQHMDAIKATLDDFDSHRTLLNTPNCVVDLATGETMPHSADLLLMKQTSVEYEPTALCPNFQGFLDTIFAKDSKPDAELIGYLQRAGGYSVTGLNSERVFFLCYGRGANGKTTFTEAITRVMGDYSQRAASDSFIQKRADTIPSDIADLKGARFVHAGELDAGAKLAESKVKELTGGESVKARHLYGKWFEFMPECKLWLSTNYKPDIRGTDNGIWSRVKLIPFTVQIPEAEQRNRDELLAEFMAEGSGILAWLVQGAVAWHAEGKQLHAPVAVTEATQAYREDQDALGDFLASRCTLSERATADGVKLYAAYMEWCGGSGTEAWNAKQFGKALEDHGFTKTRSNGNTTRHGLRLKVEG